MKLNSTGKDLLVKIKPNLNKYIENTSKFIEFDKENKLDR